MRRRPIRQALSSDLIYWAMQLTPAGTRVRILGGAAPAPAPAAVAALLATTVQMGLLGALITFAGAPLYAPHFLVTEAMGPERRWRTSRLAGLIMWAPAAGLYLGAALVPRRIAGWRAKKAGSLA